MIVRDAGTTIEDASAPDAQDASVEDAAAPDAHDAAAPDADAPLPDAAPVDQAPEIVVEPASTTVGEGGIATFRVVASAWPAPTFEWTVEGVAPVVGASTDTLAVGPVALTDEGLRARVTVTNPLGTVTSTTVVLSVAERTWTSGPRPATGASASGVAAAAEATPAVIIDSLGQTHAVFNQAEVSGGYAMWAALRRVGDADFTTFARLAEAPVPADLSASMPRLAADDTGRVLAVWNEALAAPARLRAAMFVPDASGGTWTPAVDVTDGSTPIAPERPEVVSMGGGVFEIAFSGDVAPQGPRGIFARRVVHTSGSALALDPLEALGSFSENAIRPRLAGDGRGRAILAWLVSVEGVVQTYASSRLGAAPWSAPAEIDGDAITDMNLGTIAMNTNGDGVVLMFAEGARTWARRFTFTGNDPVWIDATPAYVANHFGYDPGGLAAVVAPSGRIDVVAVHGNGFRLSRWHFEGGIWNALTPIADRTGSPLKPPVMSSPAVGLDAAENLVVTWVEHADRSVLSRRYHRALGAWREIALVQPDVFLTPTGLAVHADGSADAITLTWANDIAVPRFR
ncbi:immunoglobulin domain-containing protein [Myxococcota bacterium]|nr:immunoglobulin domain-containing protein [Myxococcota bacterium]